MKLILASGSERRNLLLSWLDIPFEVVVSDFDETIVNEKEPEKLVLQLALEKVRSVAKKVKEGLVIGADTVGFIGRQILGKPKNKKDALRMLKLLSGSRHWVYTGLAVVDAKTGKSAEKVDGTLVTFRRLSSREIQDYVDSGEPLDKGAGYAIQMGAAGFVKKVEGSYTNVVGLPLLTLAKLLEKQGYKIEKDVSEIIFKETGYRS